MVSNKLPSNLFEDIWDADCPLICIENPVGALTNHSKLGRATQYVQPYEFGHGEQKRTGFWLKGLPKLKGTKFIDVKGLPKKERHRPSLVTTIKR